jgi:hypothetical protein
VNLVDQDITVDGTERLFVSSLKMIFAQTAQSEGFFSETQET